MDIKTIELILKIILFICIAGFFGFISKYIKDFKFLNLLFSKLKENVLEYDRIRRSQVKIELEKSKNIVDATDEKKSIPFIVNIYKKIRMTGITMLIPQFSELLFIIIFLMIGFIIFIVLSIFTKPIVGLVGAFVFFITTWYLLDLIAYNRKINVEGQLLQFTNACASASRQYSNIIDIFGGIYDQFSGAFRNALQECYVETKTNNNKELALIHLKEKFNSVQLAFVIDNLDMCSKSTGDYYTVATDLSKTISIYVASHNNKVVTLRNAKVNILIMFLITLIILYMLGIFFADGLTVIFKTTLGEILLIALMGVFVYGISLKAE